MRAIDADALERDGWALHRTYQKDATTMVHEVKKIKDIPTIEPEHKRGKWKIELTQDPIGFNTVCFRCSECNGMEYGTSPFCRMCGAKMEEGEADEGD